MLQQFSRALLVAVIAASGHSIHAQQTIAPEKKVPVHLEVPAGTPLRLYLTHKVWYRQGEPVEAKFAEPVWAFDRIVIPAGTVAEGSIVSLNPVSRLVRTRAVVGGDFTPLKQAFASFTSARLPDGRTIALQTQESTGLAAIFVPPRPGKKHAARRGKLHRAEQMLERQGTNQLNARTRGLFDLVRAPNKREWLTDFGISKLPYHPQWYRNGTRFDAVLEKPLDFGTASVDARELQSIGTAPPPDAVAQMRLLTTISSADAHVGDKLAGVLAQPLFTPDHKLILPEGTRIDGKITLARRARMFHRGGKLRFALDSVEVPMIAAADSRALPVISHSVQPAEAQLAAVEANAKAVKVDREGTAKATESKTRFLRPAIAGIVAAKSMDNDMGKQNASGGGSGNPNVSGQTLGGFSGFGLLGMAVSAGPPQLAGAMGFYGLGWSVYSNLVARGGEVTFEKNAALAIRFGASPKSRGGETLRAARPPRPPSR